MAYNLEIDQAAFRVSRELPKDVQKEAITKARVLKNHPLCGKPLKGKHKSLRSLRFGFKGTAYRIIYQVFPKTSNIIIRLVSSRENIYRKLSQMRIRPFS